MITVKTEEWSTGFNVAISSDCNFTFNIKVPNFAAGEALAEKIIDAINEHASATAEKGCVHDWEEGFSMNGPTRTCRKCGKFERD